MYSESNRLESIRKNRRCIKRVLRMFTCNDQNQIVQINCTFKFQVGWKRGESKILYFSNVVEEAENFGLHAGLAFETLKNF